MSLSPYEQIAKLLEDKKSILVVTLDNNPDRLGAALGLTKFFLNTGRHCDLVVPHRAKDHHLTWLPGSSLIQATLPPSSYLIVHVPVRSDNLGGVTYEQAGDDLEIKVLPNREPLRPEGVHGHLSPSRYDLIFTVGVEDLKSLGESYQRETQLFHQVPVVNIDRSAHNDHYGSVNWVAVTASSISEMAGQLLLALAEEERLLTPEVATNLYAGLLHASQSFKSPKVTPTTLAVASKLVELGAAKDKVTSRLYQTKDVAALRLWGQILLHLEIDPIVKLASALLEPDEVPAGADFRHLGTAIEEVVTSHPEAQTVCLGVKQPNGKTVVTLHSRKTAIHRLLAETLRLPGHQNILRFQIDGVNWLKLLERIRTTIKEI